MANYTCEFSKIKDGDSMKYVQVPNENTAKRNTLKFADDFNHTPLRNLDKYKINCQKTVVVKGEGKNVTVTYYRDFKSDTTGVVTVGDSEKIIFCAFKREDGNDTNVIYIKHDDLTSKAKKECRDYDVYIRGDDDTNGNGTFTKDTTDTTATYTFLWL